jgi:ketosteroid isomerase-like protein
MSDDRNRATSQALVDALNAGDRAALDDIFTEDVVME